MYEDKNRDRGDPGGGRGTDSLPETDRGDLCDSESGERDRRGGAEVCFLQGKYRVLSYAG